MRRIVVFLALFLSLILESTVFQVPILHAVRPSLIVIVLVLIGIFRGSREGLIYGVLIGFIQDVSFGYFLGQSAFTYALIGYTSGYLRSLVMRESVLLSLLLVGVNTEFYVWLSYAISRLFGQMGTSLHAVIITSTQMTLSTMVVALLLYPVFRRLMVPKTKKMYSDETNDA